MNLINKEDVIHLFNPLGEMGSSVINTITHIPISFDIDELISRIDNRVKFYENQYDGTQKDIENHGSCKAYRDVLCLIQDCYTTEISEDYIKIAKDKSKAANMEWIPVSKRLPNVRQDEDGEPISFIVMITGAKYPTTLCINDKDEWFDNVMVEYKYNVDAWMPLPLSYYNVKDLYVE